MRVKFVTFGCKVNQYESQALREEFAARGFVVALDGTADLYVVNSCSVTGKADRKVHEAIKKIKRENPYAKIALTGCLAQLDGERVKKWGVDWVVKQDDKANIVSIVCGKDDIKKDRWALGVSEFVNHRAFVKVQDGCDNACTFCKIHHIRGRSVSRPMDSILREVEFLNEKYAEVVLTGVNLALYGRDFKNGTTLAGLVEQVLKIKNLGRLRLSSLESIFAGDELFRFLNHPKFCPHLHIPFQSGDDSVLKAMNKRERVKDYLAFVDKARAINPDVAISADFIVGFPTEDEAAFENTVEFMHKVKPMRTHIFTFSPREYTPYADYKITAERKAQVKGWREKMTRLAQSMADEYAKKFIGQKLEAICEDVVSGVKWGYTPNYLHVVLNKDVVPGSVVSVNIAKVVSGKVYAMTAV